MRLTLVLALVVFLLDQASKWVIVFEMDLVNHHAIDVLPPYLNLRMAWNTGINFGLLGGDNGAARVTLIALALAICAVVIVWLIRTKPSRASHFAAGLLLGGALGNVVDRVLYGAVADFLNMSCCGIDNPFSFNLADVAIFAGALGLALLPGGTRPH